MSPRAAPAATVEATTTPTPTDGTVESPTIELVDGRFDRQVLTQPDGPLTLAVIGVRLIEVEVSLLCGRGSQRPLHGRPRAGAETRSGGVHDPASRGRADGAHFSRPECPSRWYLLIMSSDFVVGRRAGTNGQPVGERHAVVAVATRKDPPFRAECGVKVDVVDGDWPPDGSDERGCPVCVRDTSAPWG